MPDNDKNEQIIHKINFTQREMINQFDYQPFIEGMCAGVVFAFAGLFFRTSTPTKFYSNFFPENSINPYKEFARSCTLQHQRFIKQQGDVKSFVEENFRENMKSIKITDTREHTLQHLETEIQNGSTATFIEVFLASRINPSIIPCTSHLIGFFSIDNIYFFTEPNHGLIEFNSFDDFKAWFYNETEINGILAYLPNDINQNVTDFNQYQGLAKNYKGVRNVIYSFALSLRTDIQFNSQLLHSYDNRYSNREATTKLMSRL